MKSMQAAMCVNANIRTVSQGPIGRGMTSATMPALKRSTILRGDRGANSRLASSAGNPHIHFSTEPSGVGMRNFWVLKVLAAVIGLGIFAAPFVAMYFYTSTTCDPAQQTPGFCSEWIAIGMVFPLLGWLALAVLWMAVRERWISR